MDYYKTFGIEIKRGKYQEEVFYNIALIYSLIWDRIAKYLRPFGLTPSQFNALLITKHQGKDAGLSQIQVSKKLIVSESNITRLLDKLDKAGFIVRTTLPKDRRVRLIKITEKGSRLLDKIWPGYLKKIEKVSQGFDSQSTKLLAELLGRMLGAMNVGKAE